MVINGAAGDGFGVGTAGTVAVLVFRRYWPCDLDACGRVGAQLARAGGLPVGFALCPVDAYRRLLPVQQSQDGVAFVVGIVAGVVDDPGAAVEAVGKGCAGGAACCTIRTRRHSGPQSALCCTAPGGGQRPLGAGMPAVSERCGRPSFCCCIPVWATGVISRFAAGRGCAGSGLGLAAAGAA